MKIPILFAVVSCLMLVVSPLHGQSQQELNAQGRKILEKADLELNAIYKKALAVTPDEKGVELLRQAQRAWIAFRDAEAMLHADAMRGGSAAPLLFYGRKTQLTRERIKHLQDHVELHGGR